MITSKREARRAIKSAKSSGGSVTEALQLLSAKGQKQPRLQRRLRRAHFSSAEVTTELTTAGL